MQPLKTILGESSTPSNFPRKTLDLFFFRGRGGGGGIGGGGDEVPSGGKEGRKTR